MSNSLHPAQYGPHRHLDRAVVVSSVVIVSLGMLAVQLRPWTRGELELSWYFFAHQDAILLLIVASVLWFAKWWAARTETAVRLPMPHASYPIFAAVLLALACYLGHRFLLEGYDLSRDEQMANFDAAIFSNGHLVWPIPPTWRALAGALNQKFLLPVGQNEAWTSAYLPVNAALRSFFGMLGDPALSSPVLIALGMLALWRIVLKTWPKSTSALPVALLLYVGSGQIVITGMTSYAMTGHLALNLIWLWLYLADRRSTDVGALMVGFLATGLHQPIFHPLFALPLLIPLLLRREWPRAALFVFGYLLIGLFWFAWPVWISGLGTATPTDTGPGIDYLTRLSRVVKSLDVDGIWFMALNLLRFIGWQHILLLPLVCVGLRAAWRGGDLPRALAVGLILPIPIMLVLLPYQGNGWGYRYMHGVLANAILLAVYGYESLADGSERRFRIFAVASLASVFLLLPIQSILAHRFYAPSAQIDRQIASSAADLAIIDDRNTPFAIDLVLNRPDLSNRPIRLAGDLLVADDLEKLCAGGRTLLVVAGAQLQPIDALFGVRSHPASEHVERLARAAKASGCTLLAQPQDLARLGPSEPSELMP